MIAVSRTQPDARSIVQPKSPLLRLFHWHFQPLSPPQSLNALVVNLPTCISQQRGDPTIAISAILTGQLDHVGHQPFFIRATNWYLTLSGSVLPQNATSAAFRDIQLSTNTINASTATSGAQKFPFAASVRISLSSVRSETARLSRAFSFSSSFSRFS